MRALLAQPGAQLLWTGGNCRALLIPTDRYVFGVAGEDLSAPPTADDATIQACVYPRFGRSDISAIFFDAQYEVPTMEFPASVGVEGILEKLRAYEMPAEERLRVIRACGSYQSLLWDAEGRYPESAVSFSFEGMEIYDPFHSEPGWDDVAPDTYYGEAFRTSAFFR